MGTIPGGEGNQIRDALEAEEKASSPSYLAKLRQFLEGQSPLQDRDMVFSGAPPQAASYLLSRVIPRATSRPYLVVLEKHWEAVKFFEDLEFFLAGEPSTEVVFFPEVEVSPYVPSSPNLSLTARRLESLYRLATMAKRGIRHFVMVCPVRALMEKVLDPEALLRGTLTLSVGEEMERELLTEHLLEVGYLKSNLVEEKGTFAIRGAIVDVFPPLEKNPLRLEFFGDELESIRRFNPDNQRTFARNESEKIEEVNLMPAREIYFDEVAIRRAQNEMKKRMDEADILKSERERLVEMIQHRMYFPGIEHYLPLFRKDLVFPTAYFPADLSVQIQIDSLGIRRQFEAYSQEILRCHGEAREELHPTSVIHPEERFVFTEIAARQADFPWLGQGKELWKSLRFEALEISTTRHEPIKVLCKTHETLRQQMEKARSGLGEPLQPLLDLLQDYRERGVQTFLVCARKTQSRRLLEMLAQHQVAVEFLQDGQEMPLKDSNAKVKIVLGEISGGFVLPGENLAFIVEEEIFGPRTRRWKEPKGQSRSSSAQTKLISAFSELAVGDYIVHLEFGVGRYRGLEHLSVGGVSNDFLLLEYKDGDKLFLPIYRLSRIQKYVGGEADDVALNKLGNTASWENTKERVRQNIKEVAKELVELYATRQIAKGHAFDMPDELYREFEAEFPFEETPDQAKSIDEVLRDMQSEKPMDRLICGDVGFGKTEVAIRAIFLAAMQGYQAAILAPTTVLVYQHYQTLTKRFSGYPLQVGMLSRFAKESEVEATIKGLREGSVDVVVGTHRLLSPDLNFKKLGLLVIDEEQRFGVRHKERLKSLRKNVDVLTLSATPIPRTLNMAMIGIRDLSVIETAPLDRVSIRTFVAEYDDRVIREAILRELERGGQVYFVHNRVQTIEQVATHLRSLVREARFVVAHGQMQEMQLEKVMVDFVSHEYDVLVCSSIIESGLDIPLVNTIIINHADRFGLSQLYQLRGRVGRSNRRAYAYLLVSSQLLLSELAQKRLEVLQMNTELGSGFRVASYDLEFRGAGNLLGKSQSGHVSAVGLDLYADLMNKAMRELKGEKIVDEIDPEIDLRIPAFIPQTFISEDHLRLGTYKRLSMLASEDELEEMEMELEDRFGSLPREVKNLLKVIEIKLLARQACITKVIFGGSNFLLSFDSTTPVEVEHLLHLVNTHKGWRITPENRLLVPHSGDKKLPDNVIPIDREDRILQEAKRLLEKLLKG